MPFPLFHLCLLRCLCGWNFRINEKLYSAAPHITLRRMAEVSPRSDAVSGSTRLMSLDALRGFDMFWILGADALVHALRQMTSNPVTDLLGAQLTHKEWGGFAFYDLIFPMF